MWYDEKTLESRAIHEERDREINPYWHFDEANSDEDDYSEESFGRIKPGDEQ